MEPFRAFHPFFPQPGLESSAPAASPAAMAGGIVQPCLVVTDSALAGTVLDRLIHRAYRLEFAAGIREDSDKSLSQAVL